ncbi:MAG: phage virion morphogenesis protein [Nitrospirae bacterium]|nr:phage virion morphogenesis protein [Magnetococcales bacterium]
MAGTQIKFEIHGLEAVQNALRDLQERGRSLGPALKEIGEHMIESTQSRFDAEQDPDGNAWAPLAEATQARISEFNGKKPRGGDHVLRDSRHLRNSIAYRVAGDELRVGTIAVYGAIHQLGGEAGPTAHRVFIPPRPFLGVSDADQEYALEVIRDHLLEG